MMDDIAKIRNLLDRASLEPDAAAELLAITASMLKEGRTLPKELAGYLWKALAKASKAHQSERGHILADSLGLVKQGRPTKLLPKKILIIAVAVFGEREAEVGLRKAFAEVGGISKNTAKKRINEIRLALKDAQYMQDKLMQSNGLTALVLDKSQEK